MKVFSKYFILWLTILLSNYDIRAQNTHEVDIQQISIRDTVLMNEISNMIREQEGGKYRTRFRIMV